MDEARFNQAAEGPNLFITWKCVLCTATQECIINQLRTIPSHHHGTMKLRPVGSCLIVCVWRTQASIPAMPLSLVHLLPINALIKLLCTHEYAACDCFIILPFPSLLKVKESRICLHSASNSHSPSVLKGSTCSCTNKAWCCYSKHPLTCVHPSTHIHPFEFAMSANPSKSYPLTCERWDSVHNFSPWVLRMCVGSANACRHFPLGHIKPWSTWHIPGTF